LLDGMPPVKCNAAHDQCRDNQQHQEFRHGSQCACASRGFPLCERVFLPTFYSVEEPLPSLGHNRLPRI
jgi:hypothetical protein